MKPPPGTRLVLVTKNLLDVWGTRTDDGRRLTAEWGEPDENGWYTPTFTASGPPVITDLTRQRDACMETARAFAILGGYLDPEP